MPVTGGQTAGANPSWTPGPGGRICLIKIEKSKRIDLTVSITCMDTETGALHLGHPRVFRVASARLASQLPSCPGLFVGNQDLPIRRGTRGEGASWFPVAACGNAIHY